MGAEAAAEASSPEIKGAGAPLTLQETLQHLLEAKRGGVSRIEVLAGPTGRRKWPDALKARIVAESYAPGARVADVARRHGAPPQYVTTWRRLAREGLLTLPAEMGSFVPLVVEAAPRPAAAQSSAMAIEIEASGVIVRLPIDVAATRIGEVAAALRRA